MLPKVHKKSKKSNAAPASKETTFEEQAEKADDVTRKKLLPALCLPDESAEDMVINFHRNNYYFRKTAF